MTAPNFARMSPFTTHHNKGLPRLIDPYHSSNGTVEKLANGHKRVQYIPSDSPDTWRRINNHQFDVRSALFCHEPYEDAQEMLYTVNSHNFRTFDEFNKNDAALMSLGCSHTYGVGVRDHETWPYRLAKSLNLKNWNLGSGGQSADWCVWVARAFISFGFIPKAVAIWWPDITRTIIALDKNKQDVDDKISSFILGLHDNITEKLEADVVCVSASSPYDEQSPGSILPGKGHFGKSDIQHLIEFISKREYLILLCKTHDITIVEFHGSDNWDEEFDFGGELASRSVYSIPKVDFYPTMPWADDFDPEVFLECGRDGMHYSGTFMKAVAERFEITFNENYKEFV